MSGYDENFLGVEVSLPAFEADLAKTVLVSEEFENAKGSNSLLPQGDLQVWMPYVLRFFCLPCEREGPCDSWGKRSNVRHFFGSLSTSLLLGISTTL
jgi:hypothetical protein